jgi:hypothetical protein
MMLARRTLGCWDLPSRAGVHAERRALASVRLANQRAVR